MVGREIAVYIAAGLIMAYIIWAMAQIGKVRYRSCKECLHYHMPVDHEPCEDCELELELDRPTNFVLDVSYLERHSRSS
ncbi:unnamed protein product [marine sediment metagenome]|uniref:Uncharacterized protein n=1 Tax=marine sediment metagenome TaxID=412755 RepID=X1TWH9_9ZZZZ